MAENLNYEAEGTNCTDYEVPKPNIRRTEEKKAEKPRGKGRPNALQSRGIIKLLSPRVVHECSKCYKNNPTNCDKYGRLYNWAAAEKACPDGWHLPSEGEWQTLVDLVGGKEVAGSMLKASSGWKNNGNGVDAVGFSALPGGNGFRYSSDGVGNSGSWWSASKSYYAYTSAWEIDFIIENMLQQGMDIDDGFSLYSIRCLKN